jgi:transaldolase
VPVNVTLLFSADHYRAAADAYLKGVERRIEQGLDPAVGSVASLFISRWDKAVADRVPADLKDHLGLAVGGNTYKAYRQLLDSDRVERIENAGGRAQRLLWASTSTKNPDAADTLYVHGLAAPFTVNTMPDGTLEAFYDHGEVGDPLPADGGDSDSVLSKFAGAGIDVAELGAQLQREGAASFVSSWKDLMTRIEKQSAALD